MVSPRPNSSHAPRPHGSCARRYPLSVLAQLVEAALIDVVVDDEALALVVDPIFDRAVAAALAGVDDADHAWDDAAHEVFRQLRPAS